jgi:hypothetical protein
MGPDGHTASLFPGHALLSDDRRVVAAILDAPKPPPARITLTLHVLRSAANVSARMSGGGGGGSGGGVVAYCVLVFVAYVCVCVCCVCRLRLLQRGRPRRMHLQRLRAAGRWTMACCPRAACALSAAAAATGRYGSWIATRRRSCEAWGRRRDGCAADGSCVAGRLRRPRARIPWALAGHTQKKARCIHTYMMYLRSSRLTVRDTTAFLWFSALTSVWLQT